MSRKALGKGLRELYGGITEEEYFESKNSPQTAISISLVSPNPFQPRIDFNNEAIEDLAKSIKEQGLLLPVVVRRTIDQKYQIISGERRFRALKLLEETEVPVIVREDVDDKRMLELALVENIQREDLNEIETALSYKKLIEDCNYSHQELSDKLGKSRTLITNTLRLLKLPEQIQAMLRNKQISTGHARALLGIENPVLQAQLAQEVIKKSLSVREIEKKISQHLSNGLQKKNLEEKVFTLYDKYGPVLSDINKMHGFKLFVVEAKDSSGKIEIEFNNVEEFEKIIAFLSKENYEK
ncbi:MAG: ParB/RepB/Spo0J family partition protein [Chitinispirillales bacterium]|jgi:ParB family chromosome partitioning protein|nr:ParB/RepB/Spo0J family partition protein [Chitinispirillales bacterium]